ncbi:unnamed protein product [Orchesella dallaii]|uniref:Prolyl endopeptidase n=1 Tax=Orchesella dallaii TaxID=48710 RepID=A0ABP1Q2Z7_9HEXA
MDIGKNGAITRDIPIIPLFPEPGEHQYLANDENVFYFRTNSDAANFKIISFDVEKNEWFVIVDENPSAVIDWARVVANDKLVLCYNEHLDTRLEIRKLDDSGELIKTIAFEDTISSWDHYGRRDLPDLFLRVESYLNPGILYRLYFEDYNVESETTELDGQAPCLLYGYGGFGNSILPKFNVKYVLFAQNFDGVVAVANIRGGGEYGKTWWEEGRGVNKPNAVEDFIAAANFLVNNKYTRAAKLSVMGSSNGGTVVASAVNRRPDVFGAAILDVGVMDLLRFRNFTIGHLWLVEYGDIEKEDELQAILRYSPLHNITAPGSSSPSYPAVFVTTADHDDRVVPFHSYKYLAELQHSVGQTMSQTNPLMMRVYQNIGHGYSMPTMKAIEKATDLFCFLENALGYEFHF